MHNYSPHDVVYATETFEPLPITTDDVELALLALYHYPIITPADALLVMCAANLLNAAVKQKGLPVKGGYGFKGRVSELIEGWCAHPIEGVDIQAYKDVCYVDIETIQFSFHHLAAQDKIACRAVKEPWRGIRLQPLAKRLWDAAFFTVRVSPALTQHRFVVLGSPQAYAVLEAISPRSTRIQLMETLALDAVQIDAVLNQLSHADLITIKDGEKSITVNRWTIALLQRELRALGTRKDDHASAR